MEAKRPAQPVQAVAPKSLRGKSSQRRSAAPELWPMVAKTAGGSAGRWQLPPAGPGGGTGGQGAQLLGASADGDGQGGSRRTNLENMRQTSQIDRVSGRDIGNRDMLILAG